jgi:low affinity Fe/Cu permease
MANTTWFSTASSRVSKFAGGAICFSLALASVVIWASTGPNFHYGPTWQMILNIGTSITTFLMVFLIQSSQNRDTQAIQIKLDELIRATEGAHNELIGLEELEPRNLDKVRESYVNLAERVKEASDPTASGKGIPEVELVIAAEKVVEAENDRMDGAATKPRETSPNSLPARNEV